MGTTADKLNHLINTKEGIRQEINRAYNAEEINTSDAFSSYIQKLEEHPYYLKKLVEGTIESVELSNATSIGQNAFRSCSKLTSVSFPNATSIGNTAFSSCSNLTEASFPNATSIGNNAFSSCSNLTTIYVGTNISTVCTLSSTTALGKCTNLTNIYVPASLVNSYKSATNWSSYASKIKAAS